MRFYIIEPEVAGGLGELTIMDRSRHPPIVERLHYDFLGWLGDELLQTFPCFIVTESLAGKLTLAKASGISFDPVIVTTSEEFRDLNGNMALPPFVWMKVIGRPGIDDFGVEQNRLIVSERVFAILSLRHCVVSLWPTPLNGNYADGQS